MSRRAMFSSRLERRRQVRRYALVTAAAVLAIGIAFVAMVAIQGFDFLEVADADRMPLGFAVLGALGAVVALSLVAYAAVRLFSRID